MILPTSIGIAASVLLSLSASGPLKPSIQKQIQLGNDAAKQIRKQEKVLPDSDPRTIYVRAVGRKLLKTIKTKEPWNYTFDVIESKDVNAFALPGGPSFVYTGLLNKLTSEDALAAVMGHELTHCRLEHWAKASEKDAERNLGITLIVIFTKANNNTAQLLDIGSVIAGTLPYSREVEAQADAGGYVLATDAGYNPKGMVDMFNVLLSLGGKNQKILGVDLGDHPDTRDRIKVAQARIAKDTRKFGPLTPTPPGIVREEPKVAKPAPKPDPAKPDASKPSAKPDPNQPEKPKP